MRPNLLLWKDHFLRNLKSRYLQNSLGLFWAVLHPVLLFLIYYYVFYQILRVRLPVEEKSQFMPFLAMGLWPWLAFSESVIQASSAVIDQKALLQKVRLPPWILIAAQGMSIYIIHFAGFVLISTLVLLTGESVAQTPAWTQVFYVWGLLTLFSMALWHVLAVLRVFVRDVGEMLSPLMMLWFLLTPILYSSWIIPERGRQWLELNPMHYFVSRMREAMLQGGFDYGSWDGAILLLTLALTGLAWWLYRKAVPWLEDFL